MLSEYEKSKHDNDDLDQLIQSLTNKQKDGKWNEIINEIASSNLLQNANTPLEIQNPNPRLNLTSSRGSEEHKGCEVQGSELNQTENQEKSELIVKQQLIDELTDQATIQKEIMSFQLWEIRGTPQIGEEKYQEIKTSITKEVKRLQGEYAKMSKSTELDNTITKMMELGRTDKYVDIIKLNQRKNSIKVIELKFALRKESIAYDNFAHSTTGDYTTGADTEINKNNTIVDGLITSLDESDKTAASNILKYLTDQAQIHLNKIKREDTKSIKVYQTKFQKLKDRTISLR